MTWQLRGRSPGMWTVRLPGYGQSSPVVFGETVYVTAVEGEQKDRLHLLAVDLATGKTQWQKEFAGTQKVADGDAVSRGAPTPVVHAAGVIAVYESGDVVAVSHTGEVQWQRSFVQEFGEIKGPHGYASSPLLVGDTVMLQVCHGGPSYLLAVDMATGKTRWKVDHPAQTGWSTPVAYQAAGQHGVIVSTSGSVRAFDVASGRELWWVTGIVGNSTASPSVLGDVVVIGGSSERMGPPPAAGVTAGSLAIKLGGSGDVSQTHVLWKSEKVSAGYASPLVVGDAAYFVNRVGGVQCVEVATGQVRWQHRLPGSAWASPVLAGENLFFFCKDGTVVVLKAGPEVVEVGESTISVTDIVYGVAATNDAWIVRSGRSLLKITATPATDRPVSATAP